MLASCSRSLAVWIVLSSLVVVVGPASAFAAPPEPRSAPWGTPPASDAPPATPGPAEEPGTAEGRQDVGEGEDLEEDGPSWNGQAELGLVSTSGNTDTTTVNGRFQLTHERGAWRYTTSLEMLRASNEERTTAERYLVGGQANYALSDRDYLFATVNYTDDRFSGFDYRLSEAAGYGRRLASTDSLLVEVEVGAGARQSRLAEGGDERDAIVRGKGKAEWKPREGTSLSQEVSIESGADGTVARSTSGLLAELFGGLAAKFSFAVEHTSEVPTGIDKTDTLTSVSLVYAF